MPKVDYEGRILRSTIMYPEDVLHKVIYSLSVEDFSSSEWKTLFSTIKTAALAGKKTSMDLMDHCSNAGIDLDGLISSWNSTYDVESIEEPIKTIKNRSNLFNLKRIYENAIAETSKTDTKSEEHISKIIANLSKISSRTDERSTAEIIKSLRDKSNKYIGKKIYGIPYGVPMIDNITKGMQQGHLWIIGAYTSMGKSWFAIRAMREFLRNSQRVSYYSFEMGAEEILWRLAIQDIDDQNVNLNNAKTRIDLPPNASEMLESELNILPEYPVNIIDNLSNFDELRMSILHQIYSLESKCIIVDYLQNVVMPKSQTEYDSLNRLILELQTIARKNNVFVLALSQVNRESVRVQNTNVFGFKGSGNLENACDIAVTINPIEGMNNQRQFVIGKNREGITGQVTLDVDLSRGFIKQSVGQTL